MGWARKALKRIKEVKILLGSNFPFLYFSLNVFILIWNDLKNLSSKSKMVFQKNLIIKKFNLLYPKMGSKSIKSSLLAVFHWPKSIFSILNRRNQEFFLRCVCAWPPRGPWFRRWSSAPGTRIVWRARLRRSIFRIPTAQDYISQPYN